MSGAHFISLFNLYAEHIWNTELDLEEGVKIVGSNINNLRYADDIILLAKSSNGLNNWWKWKSAKATAFEHQEDKNE